METFTDAQFMTATEKAKVLKAWKTFLSHGLQEQHFTDRLYKHLSLHCGFIAHYNRAGFYGTYFSGDQIDLEKFFSHFNSSHSYFHQPMSAYEDLNYAMIKHFEACKDALFKKATQETDNRFELLKEMIKRSETDLDFRKQVISKIF